MTSVYRVTKRGKHGGPSAMKIAIKRHSQISVGETLEEGSGRLIAIQEGLLAFIPEKYGFTHPMTGIEREPAAVNTRYWEGGSSPIVALFETQKEAAECFETNDLVPADSRWIDSTNRILEMIGNDHPAFVISHWHGDCFPTVHAE